MTTTISTTAPMPTAISQSACVSNAAMMSEAHLPTAIFLRDRAMCRMRTAQSLTSSTPCFEAGCLSADDIDAGRCSSRLIGDARRQREDGRHDDDHHHDDDERK